MQFETNTVSMTKRDFFWIIMRILYPKKWSFRITITLALLLIVYNLTIGHIHLITWIVIGCILFIFVIVPINFIRYANSLENNIFYLDRKYIIDDDMIKTELSDKSKSEVKLKNIFKVLKYNKYYLLFISKQQFYYLPVDSFKSINDLKVFDDFCRVNNLIKK